MSATLYSFTVWKLKILHKRREFLISLLFLLLCSGWFCEFYTFYYKTGYSYTDFNGSVFWVGVGYGLLFLISRIISLEITLGSIIYCSIGLFSIMVYVTYCFCSHSFRDSSTDRMNLDARISFISPAMISVASAMFLSRVGLPRFVVFALIFYIFVVWAIFVRASPILYIIAASFVVLIFIDVYLVDRALFDRYTLLAESYEKIAGKKKPAPVANPGTGLGTKTPPRITHHDSTGERDLLAFGQIYALDEDRCGDVKVLSETCASMFLTEQRIDRICGELSKACAKLIIRERKSQEGFSMDKSAYNSKEIVSNISLDNLSEINNDGVAAKSGGSGKIAGSSATSRDNDSIASEMQSTDDMDTPALINFSNKLADDLEISLTATMSSDLSNPGARAVNFFCFCRYFQIMCLSTRVSLSSTLNVASVGLKLGKEEWNLPLPYHNQMDLYRFVYDIPRLSVLTEKSKQNEKPYSTIVFSKLCLSVFCILEAYYSSSLLLFCDDDPELEVTILTNNIPLMEMQLLLLLLTALEPEVNAGNGVIVDGVYAVRCFPVKGDIVKHGTMFTFEKWNVTVERTMVVSSDKCTKESVEHNNESHSKSLTYRLANRMAQLFFYSKVEEARKIITGKTGCTLAVTSYKLTLHTAKEIFGSNASYQLCKRLLTFLTPGTEFSPSKIQSPLGSSIMRFNRSDRLGDRRFDSDYVNYKAVNGMSGYDRSNDGVYKFDEYAPGVGTVPSKQTKLTYQHAWLYVDSHISGEAYRVQSFREKLRDLSLPLYYCPVYLLYKYSNRHPVAFVHEELLKKFREQIRRDLVHIASAIIVVSNMSISENSLDGLDASKSLRIVERIPLSSQISEIYFSVQKAARLAEPRTKRLISKTYSPYAESAFSTFSSTNAPTRIGSKVKYQNIQVQPSVISETAEKTKKFREKLAVRRQFKDFQQLWAGLVRQLIDIVEIDRLTRMDDRTFMLSVLEGCQARISAIVVNTECLKNAAEQFESIAYSEPNITHNNYLVSNRAKRMRYVFEVYHPIIKRMNRFLQSQPKEFLKLAGEAEMLALKASEDGFLLLSCGATTLQEVIGLVLLLHSYHVWGSDGDVEIPTDKGIRTKSYKSVNRDLKQHYKNLFLKQSGAVRGRSGSGRVSHKSHYNRKGNSSSKALTSVQESEFEDSEDAENDTFSGSIVVSTTNAHTENFSTKYPDIFASTFENPLDPALLQIIADMLQQLNDFLYNFNAGKFM